MAGRSGRPASCGIGRSTGGRSAGRCLRDQPRQAAVWTWESREQKAEYGRRDAHPYLFPKGTFFITRDEHGRAYYLGLDRTPEFRGEAKSGEIVALWRPVLTREELWVFQHELLFGNLPDRQRLEAARERDLPAPEDPGRKTAGGWTPQDTYSRGVRGTVGAWAAVDAGGNYRHVLETLDGEPVFCSTFDRPKSEVPAKTYRPRHDQEVRAARRATVSRDRRRGVPHRLEDRLGVGYRFLAVDWSQKAASRRC